MVGKLFAKKTASFGFPSSKPQRGSGTRKRVFRNSRVSSQNKLVVLVYL
jgi:hypothetical protein